MLFNEQELEIQRQIISVMIELDQAAELLFSKVNQAGWSQRNALISHVYSEYEKHKELEHKRNKWEQISLEHRVHKKLYNLLCEYRDLYGYFPAYKRMLIQFDDLLKTALIKEEYEIATILQKWRKRFPN